jgi:hypothetical protein
MVDVQQQAASKKNGFLTAKTHKIPTQFASAVNKVPPIQFATTSVACRATLCILNAPPYIPVGSEKPARPIFGTFQSVFPFECLLKEMRRTGREICWFCLGPVAGSHGPHFVL